MRFKMSYRILRTLYDLSKDFNMNDNRVNVSLIGKHLGIWGHNIHDNVMFLIRKGYISSEKIGRERFLYIMPKGVVLMDVLEEYLKGGKE